VDVKIAPARKGSVFLDTKPNCTPHHTESEDLTSVVVEFHLSGYNIMLSVASQRTVRMNILPPASRIKTMPSEKPENKMTCSSETSEYIVL
jgi:hypothetical protein